jgi:hypothetical protein
MPEVTYTCAVCGETFESQEALADHMVTYHSTKDEVSEEGEEK